VIRFHVSWLNLLGLSSEPVLLDTATGMWVPSLSGRSDEVAQTRIVLTNGGLALCPQT
jgi:hypothetical protein